MKIFIEIVPEKGPMIFTTKPEQRTEKRIRPFIRLEIQSEINTKSLIRVLKDTLEKAAIKFQEVQP